MHHRVQLRRGTRAIQHIYTVGLFSHCCENVTTLPGGLMALYAGVRAPGILGGILTQSGAFSIGGRDLIIWDLDRNGPVRPLQIWMDMGRHEWLLPGNRRMHELLVDRGYDVAFRECCGGQDCLPWRNDLWRGLEVLFGHP